MDGEAAHTTIPIYPGFDAEFLHDLTTNGDFLRSCVDVPFPLCLADTLILALVLLGRRSGYTSIELVPPVSIEFIIKNRLGP